MDQYIPEVDGLNSNGIDRYFCAAGSVPWKPDGKEVELFFMLIRACLLKTGSYEEPLFIILAFRRRPLLVKVNMSFTSPCRA
jgi:hypothetical protein